MKYLLSLLALACTASIASPGDDGCVGNCAPRPGNGDAGVGSISNDSRAVSEAYSGSVSSAVGVGLGGAGGGGGAGGAGGAAAGGSATAAGGLGVGHGGSAVVTGVQGGSVGPVTGGSSQASTGDLTSTNTAAGGSVSINTQGSRAAYAPDVIGSATAPCRVAVGGSVGWLGGALGFGGSVLDEGCHRARVVLTLQGLGQAQAALLVMCNDKEAAKALGPAVCPPPAAPKQEALLP